MTSGYLLDSVPTSSNPMRDKDSMNIRRGRIEPLRGLLIGTLLVAAICPGTVAAQTGAPPSPTAAPPTATPPTAAPPTAAPAPELQPVVKKAPPPMSVEEAEEVVGQLGEVSSFLGLMCLD